MPTNLYQTLASYKDLIINLSVRELKSRYSGTVLGFFWSILNPLFMALIYMVFLRLLVGRGVPTEDILIGVFAWQYTGQSVFSGQSCINGNANLVKKVNFPRFLLPLSFSAGNLIHHLLALGVQIVMVIGLLLWKGSMISVWVLALPLLVAYHSLFNLGLTLLVSTSHVYFRDTNHIVSIVMQAWFFMTPIIYNLSFIDRFMDRAPWLWNIYLLNPMAGMVTAYRALQIPESIFPWSWPIVIGLALPVPLLFYSYRIFQRYQKYFSDLV
jgi:ABC-type polysaccharide/polyol phosphate export permease